MTELRDAIYAAGTVLWREVDGDVVVAVVHRDRYHDVSLPKGKLDPGETLPVTARRETEEETGIRVVLGRPVGTAVYRQPSGRSKIVQYWAAHVSDSALRRSTFRPNREISGVEWVPLRRVRRRLSYAEDVKILDTFASFVRTKTLETFPVVVLRHAEAVSRGNWRGPDQQRPLSRTGLHDAERMVATLSAFGVKRMFSSPAVRCVETVAPLAAKIARAPKENINLSQDAWEKGEAALGPLVAKRVAKRKPVVLCSHRPVIPDIMRQLLLATRAATGPYEPDAIALPTAGCAVVHLTNDAQQPSIVAVEAHAPAPQ